MAEKRVDSKTVRDADRTSGGPVILPGGVEGETSRELQRVTGNTPVEDPREFAAKRRKTTEPATPDDRPQDKGKRGSHTFKATGGDTLTWTGGNVDEMVEFCGPDPLGQPAATFNRFWAGDLELTVFDRSGGENEIGTQHAVKRGQAVVRSEQEHDGGWGSLRVIDVDEDPEPTAEEKARERQERAAQERRVDTAPSPSTARKAA